MAWYNKTIINLWSYNMKSRSRPVYRWWYPVLRWQCFSWQPGQGWYQTYLKSNLISSGHGAVGLGATETFFYKSDLHSIMYYPMQIAMCSCITGGESAWQGGTTICHIDQSCLPDWRTDWDILIARSENWQYLYQTAQLLWMTKELWVLYTCVYAGRRGGRRGVVSWPILLWVIFLVPILHFYFAFQCICFRCLF